MHDTGTTRRRSAIDGRTTRHDGYAVSQKRRKRIEEVFGWLKTIGGLRQTRFRGLDGVRMASPSPLPLQPHPLAEAHGKNRIIEAVTRHLWEMPIRTSRTVNSSRHPPASTLRQSKSSPPRPQYLLPNAYFPAC
jgi:hypothetical protein